jgi:hypothetical protein
VLLAAITAGCLLPPAAVREATRESWPPATNHFRPAPPAAATTLADGFIATPGAAAATPIASWPPDRGRLRARPSPPAAAWPPPFRPRPGQLVASEQGSAQGLFLSLFAAEYHDFVHTGMVVADRDGLFVYETNGFIRAELGGTPAQRVAGGARRVPWDDFVGSQRFVAVFDPPAGLDVDRSIGWLRERLGTPFDLRFEPRDDAALYCSELTAKALAAGGAPPSLVPFRTNASLGAVRAWIGITADGLYVPPAITGPGPPVALVSRWHSRRQIHAYFAAKHELHRRFTPDQPLGNVIAYSPWRGLRLRPAVQGFLAAVDAAAAGWPEAEAPDTAALAARVAVLAQLYLGAGPAPAAQDPAPAGSTPRAGG